MAKLANLANRKQNLVNFVKFVMQKKDQAACAETPRDCVIVNHLYSVYVSPCAYPHALKFVGGSRFPKRYKLKGRGQTERKEAKENRPGERFLLCCCTVYVSAKRLLRQSRV